MRARIATTFATLLIASLAAGHAAAQAQLVTANNDWSLFKAQSGGACFGATLAKARQPSSLNHGDNFFMVMDDAGRVSPQFVAGYAMNEQNPVTVTVGNQNFEMFAEGNRAWLADSSQSTALVDAMKAGSDMTLRTQSQRGNDTSYVFSLSGATATINGLNGC